MKPKVLLLIMLAFCLNSSIGQVIHVPTDQPTIQAGIDAAVDGDTVLISDGTYYENINFNGKAITVASHYLVDGNPLHVLGTIIDGSLFSRYDTASVVSFISGEDTTSILYGLTIQGGLGTSAFTFDNQQIGGGIVCLNSGAKIMHNRIQNNNITHLTYAFGGGLGSFSENMDDWLVVSDNSFFHNACTTTGDDSQLRSAAGAGMYIGCNARIHNNSIYNNTCTSSYLADGAGIEVESNYFGGGPFTVNLTDNTIQYNTAVGGLQPEGGGLNLIVTKMNIINNKINYNALIGDDYALGAGVNFLGIESMGDLVIFEGNEVIGNTIQGSSINWGTAMNLSNIDHQIEIRNNLFRDNDGTETSVSQGTVFIWIYSSSYSGHDSRIIFDCNTFINNSSKYGGAISARNSFNFSLTNNVFLNNWAELGGAIYLEQTGSMTQETMSVISNNTFVNNEAQAVGSAIYNNYLTETVATFNNIYWQNTSPNGDEIYVAATNPPLMPVSYSLVDTSKITGSWAGINNFHDDPDLDEDSIHISGGSPCFNAGTTIFSYGDYTFFSTQRDIDGESRPMYGGIDVGADEYFIVGLRLIEQEDQLSFHVHPNPFAHHTTLSFDLESPEHCLLEVYNSSGLWVETISDMKYDRGHHQIQWESTHLAGGLYFLRFTAGQKKSVVIGLKI